LPSRPLNPRQVARGFPEYADGFDRLACAAVRAEPWGLREPRSFFGNRSVARAKGAFSRRFSCCMLPSAITCELPP